MNEKLNNKLHEIELKRIELEIRKCDIEMARIKAIEELLYKISNIDINELH